MMTSAEMDKLRESVSKWRSIAAGAGPQHSLWDLIFDAESLLDGRPTILSEEEILLAAKEPE